MPAPARSAARIVTAALGAVLVLACRGPEAPTLPPGAHVVADGAVLRDLLARVEGLHGTPLGGRAVALGRRLADCDSVVGHAADASLDALLDSLECAPAPPELAAARGDAALLWVWPVGPARRWIVTGGPDATGLVLEARLDPPGASDRAELLLPSTDDAGPPVLDAQDALLHARVRPVGGLDLAALVPEGSQGDRLFRLKSALLGSAVLGGVWEVAAYMPEPGAPLPPMALALDVRHHDAAVRAMQGFVHELETTWPIHATPAHFAAGTEPGADARRAGDASPREGACIFDLRILPGFAPCWVATSRALVVGWNPASVERALAGSAEEGEGGPSRLALRLDRLGEADRRLQAARLGSAETTSRTWGWKRLEIVPGAHDGALRIELADPEPAG